MSYIQPQSSNLVELCEFFGNGFLLVVFAAGNVFHASNQNNKSNIERKTNEFKTLNLQFALNLSILFSCLPFGIKELINFSMEWSLLSSSFDFYAT